MQKHWSGFLNAVNSKPIPQTSNVAPYPTTDSTPGTSGFMDVFSKNTKKYDKITGSSGGIDPSGGVYKFQSIFGEKQ